MFTQYRVRTETQSAVNFLTSSRHQHHAIIVNGRHRRHRAFAYDRASLRHHHGLSTWSRARCLRLYPRPILYKIYRACVSHTLARTHTAPLLMCENGQRTMLLCATAMAEWTRARVRFNQALRTGLGSASLCQRPSSHSHTQTHTHTHGLRLRAYAFVCKASEPNARMRV